MVDDQVQAYSRADVSAVTFGGEPANRTQDVPDDRVLAEPENIGLVYLQDESRALRQWERNQGIERPGGSGLRSRGQGAVYWEMAGAKSPVRLKSGQKMVFVVRLANNIDPATVALFPLDTRQDKRRTRSEPGSRSSPLQVALEITNFGEVSYGLTPVNQLPPANTPLAPRTRTTLIVSLSIRPRANHAVSAESELLSTPPRLVLGQPQLRGPFAHPHQPGSIYVLQSRRMHRSGTVRASH